MPKGVQEERTTTCRSCSREFTTRACGKAAWYCRQDDCPGPPVKKRVRKPRSRKPPQPPVVVKTSPDLRAFAEDLVAISELASRLQLQRHSLRDAVRAVARNPTRQSYRVLAAFALRMAATRAAGYRED